MLAQIRRCLDDYQENYRRPGLPPLEPRGMYALFPEEGQPDFVESHWNDPYPNADRKGVYLIFGKSGVLLYVGKASMGSTIGGRLGTYFAGRQECRLLFTDWSERPTYIATIAVPPGMGFEASALEEFLIKTLKPCDNNLGVTGRVPVSGALESDEATETPDAHPSRTATALPPGVYTYSAPGMPLCPMCEQRPAIFYCSAHQVAACLECVARHDEAGQCAYVPAYRAPRPPVAQPAASQSNPPSTGRSTSILGI